MTNVDPVVVCPNDVDKLLILAARFEGLIGRYGLAFNVFHEFANQITPVSFGIAFSEP